MGGARGIPLYAMEYPRFCKQTQIHIHIHYIYIVFGSGTMAKASPAPAIVALRRASQPTTKKLMACMHWHCSTESFCSASASLQLSAEQKRKKKAFLFTAAERQSGRQHAPYLILVLHAFMLVGFLSLP